jgi:hypothetical protein
MCISAGLQSNKITFFSDGVIPGGRRGLRIRNGNRTTDYGFIDAPPTSQQQQQQQQQQTKSRVKEQCAKSGKYVDDFGNWTQHNDTQNNDIQHFSDIKVMEEDQL